MKIIQKTTQLMLLVLFASQTFSQTQKGDILLQAVGSYSQQETDFNLRDKGKNNFSQINTRLGFFVSKYVILGLGIGYSKRETKGNDYIDPTFTVDYTTNRQLINYYFYGAVQSKISDNLHLNFGLDIRLGRGDYEETNRYKFDDNNGILQTFNEDYNGDVVENEVLFKPGLFYFLGKGFILQLSYGQIGIINTTLDLENENNLDDNLLVASFNPETLRLGLTFHIQKREINKNE